MSKKLYTTVEVAKREDVPRATLQFWISSGKIAAPEVQLIAGKAVRLWSETDIGKVRKLKGSLKRGPQKQKK
jgi:DNA-binding transcriptional MerR regulator